MTDIKIGSFVEIVRSPPGRPGVEGVRLFVVNIREAHNGSALYDLAVSKNAYDSVKYLQQQLRDVTTIGIRQEERNRMWNQLCIERAKIDEGWAAKYLKVIR